MLLGFHVSIVGSIDVAVDRAIKMDCTTFQIFTRNPRGWKFTDLDEEEVNVFVKKCEEQGYQYPAVHMPYLPNSVGSKFENLRYVLDNVEPDRQIGICFDTSHAFAAGYDLRNSEDVDRSMSLLDDIIGLDKVKVVHLNDSKGVFNSHSDRHDHIGLGYIGEDGFRAFLKHKLAKTRPLVMETPVDSRCDDMGNLKKVRELADES
jgi:endonuclease IV